MNYVINTFINDISKDQNINYTDLYQIYNLIDNKLSTDNQKIISILILAAALKNINDVCEGIYTPTQIDMMYLLQKGINK